MCSEQTLGELPVIWELAGFDKFLVNPGNRKGGVLDPTTCLTVILDNLSGAGPTQFVNLPIDRSTVSVSSKEVVLADLEDLKLTVAETVKEVFLEIGCLKAAALNVFPVDGRYLVRGR